MPTARILIQRLRASADPAVVSGMKRFGIRTQRALGVSMPTLRGIAREVGTDHLVAGELWKSGIHEARILASLIDEPDEVTEAQLERWVSQFDSWDLCDQCCANLFEKTPFAYSKASAWARRQEEYVKRAGFALMARLAVSDKNAPDRRFLPFLNLIRHEANDKRDQVRKAVNWALRQIGKRNRTLNLLALECAQKMIDPESHRLQWVATDAIRELASPAVKRRIQKDAGRRGTRRH